MFAELDKKMKAVMTILEENDSSSVERDQIFNNRKPELIQRLEDFNRSYCSLAEQCALLRSKSHHVFHLGCPSSSSFSYSRKVGYQSKSQKRVVRSFSDPKLVAFDSTSEPVFGDPDVQYNNIHFHFEYLNRLADELMSTDSFENVLETETEIKDNDKGKETTEVPNKEKMKINGSDISEATTEEFLTGSFEWKNTWHELKFRVTKLMQESLRQQAELLKRNEDKRKTIKALRAQMEHLRSQNRALQSSLRFSKVEVKSNRFHMPRLSGLLFNKFFKGGCS